MFKKENWKNNIKFNPENKKNRILLFYGIKIKNILWILYQNLLIYPIEVLLPGSL